MIYKIYKKLRYSQEGNFTPNMIYGMTLWLILIYINSQYSNSALKELAYKNPIIASIVFTSSWGVCMLIPGLLKICIKKIDDLRRK